MNDPDSDDDGLLDGAEVFTYNTDPLDNDSDNDGLLDGAEVNDYGTDPASADSIVISRPADGETWTLGKKARIRWNSEGAVGDFVRIELRRNGSFARKIKRSANNDGKFNWRVPDNVQTGGGYTVYIRSKAVPMIDDIGNTH